MNRIVKNKKKALSMALVAALAIAPVNAFAASSDVRGHWAEKTITEWQDKGLIGGYSDGTFKPNKAATRAEFARMMNQALNLNTLGTVAFSDVSASDWYYNDVAIALGEAYTAGYPDGTFKPNDTITRAQAAVFIAKAIGASYGRTPSFTDASNIPAWAQGAVGAVVEKGYMSGYPDGSFKPNAVLTRAEALSTLNRIMGTDVEAPKEEVVSEKDVVIEKDDTKLENQTVEGNVIISEKVGDGEVYLTNVEIKGDLIVQGGGDDSIYVKDTTVDGKTVLDKKNVRLQVSGKTKLPTVEFKKAANLNAKNFDGTIGRISIANEISDKITIGAPADKLYVDNTANIVIKSDVADVIIDEDAAGTKVEVESGAKVGTLTADAKVALSGSGKVSTLEANVDGVTYSSSVNITKTETAKGVKEPSKSNASSGGGGSSSESSKKKTDEPTIKTPTAGDTTISGTAVKGATVTVTIAGAASSTKTATAKEDGKWSITVTALTAGDKITAVAKASGKKNSDTVTVTVKAATVNKEITDFTELTAVELADDDHLVDLTALKASGKLPTEVTVTDGTTPTTATITDWTGAFDGTVTGDKTLTAVWTMPSGYVDGTDPITVTIIVNVNTAQTAAKVASTVAFATAGPIAKLTSDPAFTNAATGAGDGAITYTSADEAVATVDATTGEVTIVGVGTVVITASQAESSTHLAGTTTYTLNVTVE